VYCKPSAKQYPMLAHCDSMDLASRYLHTMGNSPLAAVSLINASQCQRGEVLRADRRRSVMLAIQERWGYTPMISLLSLFQNIGVPFSRTFNRFDVTEETRVQIAKTREFNVCENDKNNFENPEMLICEFLQPHCEKRTTVIDRLTLSQRTCN
jgi:hypothetical protein